MNKTTLTNILLGLFAAVIITYFFPHPEANQYKFEEGRPWNYAQLIAPFDIPIRPDSATMLAVRDSLDRTFVPVFERNPEVITEIITTLMGEWTQADADREPSVEEAATRRKAVAYLRQAYSRDVIDSEHGERIIAGIMPNIRIMENNTVRHVTSTGISSIDQVLQGLQMALGIDSVLALKWIEANKIEEALLPNLPFNQEISGHLYQSDFDRFTAIKGVIQQGQTIINKGAVITPQDYTNLLTYESMMREQVKSDKGSVWLMWTGQFLYALIILAALYSFLCFSAPKVWANKKAVMFILTCITLFFIIAVLVEDALPNAVFIVPFAIVPILMVVFFDAPTALFTSFTLIIMVSGAVAIPLEFFVIELSACVAAIYSLRELTQRSQLMRTSLFVLGAYIIAYTTLELMLNGSTADMQWRMVIYLVISSVLASMAYILMVAIEKVFGFVSVVTLIELSDVSNPLLRELSQECPGTFQHSMAVGNLATDAAIKIGANEPMVRVGALYHDIGKLSNPNFFTENQHGVNPHDALPIESSVKIIIGHVNDGLTRAEKAGLPAVIKDFISQHHGQGQAKYFYYTYCKQHPDEDVDPTPFTYPGPNPQTREASILMMADSVEAASRSLKEHTPEAITALVNKIIDQQVADGLHNESPLHFRDVELIKQAFIRRLMTMYHSRIVYPDAPNKNDSNKK